MAEKKDKTLAYLLLGLGVAAGAYALFAPQTTGGNNNNTSIPPGGTIQTPWGAWTNNTGSPTWLTATDTIVDGAGDILGSVENIIKAVNAGKTSVGNTQAGGYYNPLPGGLM